MILVTGATGNIGRHVVSELIRAGAEVRALTRDPATARLPGGVQVARTGEPALAGVTSIFLNPAVFWDGLDDLLSRAACHGAGRVVMLSTAAVLDGDPSNTMAVHHRRFERAVEDSGMEWTFPRPAEFASNMLRWRDAIRTGVAVRGPYAAARTTPIHERDVAAVAAAALLTDDHVGTRPILTGPEVVTQPQMVRLIGEAIGRPARFEEITPEEARKEMLARTRMSEQAVDVLLSLRARSVVEAPRTSPEVERLTGRPARTFAEWAADHTGDFS